MDKFIDYYKCLRRVPQIMLLKDIGAIVAETGINSKSVVVDAGAGSGALACFLANICKRVVSYEIRKDFAKVAKENAKKLGLKNAIIKNKDIRKGIAERNVDLITLDLPEPWKIIMKAEKSLKQGAFLVAYCPQITQSIEFVKAVKKSKKMVYVKTVETFWRQWLIDERRARPESTAIVHTGFLSFARKK
jgi:tRNA (adenine57-N1/adenine58-N1)-methyltransferase